MVSKFLQKNTTQGDTVFVSDSDVVPYRVQSSLDHWLNLTKFEDLAFYDRIWNPELAAGNYMVRNTAKAQEFLMGWASWESKRPPGFSSADNGALHVHLLEVLGLDDSFRRCNKLYMNLTADVMNLNPYFEYIECARTQTPAGVYKSKGDNSLSIRIIPKGQAWVVDGVYDPDSLSNMEAPVFHHGVKLEGNRKHDLFKHEKYLIPMPEETTDVICEPLQSAAQCKQEALDLGSGMDTAAHCAPKVNHFSKCGDIFMFSKAYPAWGCRCCKSDDVHIFDPNSLWNLYSSRECLGMIKEHENKTQKSNHA